MEYWLVLVVLLDLLLGVFVLVKGRRGCVTTSFGLITILIAFWTIFLYFSDHPIKPEWALWWNRAIFAVAFAQAATLFYFGTVFPFPSKKLRDFCYIVIFPAAFVLGLISLVTPYIVGNIYFEDWGTDFDPGFLYPVFVVFMAGAILGLLTLLIIKYRKSTGLAKLQLKYVFFGFLLTAVFALTTNVFLPAFIGFESAIYGPISSFFLIIFTIYAITRYRLMDLRIILRRFMVEILVAGVFLSFILGSIYFVAAIIAQRIPDYKLVVTGALAMVLALFFYQPIRRNFEKIANKYFFTSLANYQKTLTELSDSLVRIIELPKILELIITKALKVWHLKKVAIVLREDMDRGAVEKGMSQGFSEVELRKLLVINFPQKHFIKHRETLVFSELNRIHQKNIVRTNNRREFKYLLEIMKDIEVEILIPLISGENLVGIICLGSKISQDAFTKEDFELLEGLGNQASIAIENAILYQEEQQAKDILADFNAELEEKVEAQTKEIVTKNKRLSRLLRMKSDFLDTASHQLRTPVSVIKSTVSMMREGDLVRLPVKTQKKYLDFMWQKSLKLEEIIENILAASEMDTLDEIIPESMKGPLDIKQMVKKVASEQKDEARQAGLGFEVKITRQKLPLIFGSASYLEQAIGNIIGNAIKYTKPKNQTSGDKGKVVVEVQKKGAGVEVQVRDNGIGIPADEVKELFKKFRRGSNAVDVYADGTGLGLFIVRRIVESHGGKVSVESALGEGSEFTIFLPAVKEK